MKRCPKLPLLPALLSLLLTGCTLLGLDHERLDEIRAKQRAWAAQGISDYQVVLTIGCFCDPETLKPVRLEVAGGVTVSVKRAEDGTPVTGAPGTYRNIDQVFEWLETFARDDDNLIERLEYHPTYHYPADVSGYTRDRLDSGIAYRFTEFVRR